MLIRILVTIAAFCLLYPMNAEAKRPPKCGELSRSDIKDIYEAAQDLRYIYDYDENITDLCTFMQEFEDWNDDLPRDFRRSKSYDKAKDALLARIEGHIQDLRRPLRLLYLWVRAEANNAYELVLKENRIRKGRDDVERILEKLEEDQERVRTFMKDQEQLIPVEENP